MPYPDAMTSAALDRHNGRDELDRRIADMIADDEDAAAKLTLEIEHVIACIGRLHFRLGWPAAGMDEASTLAALRDCLPQPNETLLRDRIERAREILEDEAND